MAAPTIFSIQPVGAAARRCLSRTPRPPHNNLLGRPLQRATFFGLPTPPSPFATQQEPTLLTASRRLPYDSHALFAVIADVDAYSSFLPYCQHSRVTAWRTVTGSKPSSSHLPVVQRWPAAGDLTVGWGPFTESYSSRLYCIPGRVVEAVSGKGRPSITAEEATLWGLDLGREGGDMADSDVGSAGIFESLVTRWTFTPIRQHQHQHQHQHQQEALTDVELTIRYRFLNPVYQVAMGKASGEVAGLMIKAFERRARELLGKRAQL